MFKEYPKFPNSKFVLIKVILLVSHLTNSIFSEKAHLQEYKLNDKKNINSLFIVLLLIFEQI